MMLNSSSVIELTGALRRVNTSVAAWNTFHVFFPFPQKRIPCHSLWTRGQRGELYILTQAPLSSDEPESTESLSLFRRQSTIHWYEDQWKQI
jgi:hypothetical protein